MGIETSGYVVVAAGVNPRLGQPTPSYWQSIRDAFFQWADIQEEKEQQVILRYCFLNYNDDVVLLRLQSPLPEGIVPADRDTAEDSVGDESGHTFESLGYRCREAYQGLPANGTIFNFAGSHSERTMQFDRLMLDSKHIDGGMSGSE
jgi:hypothetical protein